MDILFRARAAGAAPAAISRIVDAAVAPELLRLLAQCPAYAPTPLLELTSFARQAGIGSIAYKDESQRFSLGSFKALGGTYAVGKVLHRLQWPGEGGFDPARLLEAAARLRARQWRVVCATDGNHGRAVAAGARLFGCQCVVYMHAGVSAGRAAAVAALGAQVVRVDGDYDASVRAAQAACERDGSIPVSDTAYPGSGEVPRWVMEGYTAMLAEVAAQSARPFTHVFIQAGVGGLAAAAAAWLWQTLGAARPQLVVVEPRGADCLYQSALANAPRAASGPVDTQLAGLACGEVSSMAWEVLREAADAFMRIDDSQALGLMRPLAQHAPAIVAGESATAGLAGLLACAADAAAARRLRLDAHSRVLVFGTEGATDPDIYRRHVGGASKG